MSRAGTPEKLTCQQAEEWLVDYLYGELEPELSEAFRRHLEECPTHREEVGSLQAVISLIRQQPAEMPEELSDRIRSAVGQKLEERPAARSWWWWLGSSPLPAALAAGGAVVLLTVALWHMAEVSRQAPETVSQPVKVAEKPMPAAAPAPAPAEERYFAVDRLAEAEPPESGGEVAAGRKAGSPASARPRAKKSAEFAATKKAPAVARPVATAEKVAGPELAEATTMDGVPPSPEPFEPEARKGPPAKLPGAAANTQTRKSKSIEYDEAAEAQAVGGAVGKLESTPAEKPTAPQATSVAATPSRPKRVAAQRKPQQPPPAEAKPAAEEIAAESEGRSARDDKDSRRTVAQDKERSQSTTDAEFERARAFMKAGDCEKQIQAAKRAVAGFPDHRQAAQTLLDQASCLVKLQRFEEAREVYRRVERDFPAYAEEARAGLRRLEGK